jgi:hypothetical protein
MKKSVLKELVEVLEKQAEVLCRIAKSLETLTWLWLEAAGRLPKREEAEEGEGGE